MNPRHAALLLLIVGCLPASAFAQRKIPPYDLWNSQVLADIRNQTTLEPQISSLSNILVKSYDVYFTSNRSASFFDATPPYAEHVGETITIHAYLAVPYTAGPHPALVIGHGHGGQADLNLAQLVALYGYVAIAIDGPQAGKSTGGPKDDNQAWISVDKGPEYGYLYHYAYAGMRALTLLQLLGNQPGNPYNIDANRLGVFGASMGGIFTSYINGVDDRVKAAIILACAGNWQHSLRDPNGWLYHGIYTGARDLPYDGADPLNSIENVDTDSTAVTFFEYFDPIRYAVRQHAPVLTVIGTHDGYFPLPEANLTLQAMTSAGAQPNFEKRLWLLPNAMHGLSTTSSSESVSDLTSIVTPLVEWLKYCFGTREKPLATPQISLIDTGSGLRFEVTLAETAARLANATVKINLATKIDSTVTPVQDFKEYAASQQNDRYVVQLSKGEKSSSGDVLDVDNAVYFATVTDGPGLQVSSLVYKGTLPIDLSTDFTPKIDQYPGDNVVAPVPPDYTPPATTIASSIPLAGDVDYQGMALTNPTSTPMAVRVEAWTPDGRLGAAEGLVNPVFMTLPGYSQRIFVAEEWFGPGARRFDGSLRMGWSDAHATALAFRGKAAPSQLEAIGPLSLNPTPFWLPLVPDQDAGASRRLRIFTAAGSGAADVKVTFRDNTGTAVATQTVSVPPSGTADIVLSQIPGLSSAVSASIEATAAAAARLEAMGNSDPWSIEARPAPPAARLIQPHVEWNGTFTTRLLMLNTSAAALTATFKLYRRDGSSPAADATRTIPAGSVLNERVESLFGIAANAPAGAGWFEVQTGGPGILVTALAVDPKAGAAAASAPGIGAAGNWSMPFFVQNSGYWTGLALANPGDTPAIVTITAYDPSGTVLGSVTPPILGAKQSVTQLVSQWMPGLAGDATGQIIISTTAPVSLLAYFGTGDSASLAAIPFTPIAP